MKKILAFCFICFTFSMEVNAQSEMDSVKAIVYDGDTIPLMMLHTADVFGTISPEASANLKKYYLLRRDVMRAYPYAKLAGEKIKIMNQELEALDRRRDRKRYISDEEYKLKESFEKNLKNLTVNQGKILMKLIDRETGITTYAVVKEYRGGFQAFVWQTTARFFGHNMKSEYDPTGEDYLVEQIVQQIEHGQLIIPAAYQVQVNK